MLLILDVFVVQTLLMLQISYPLVFVQMEHHKLNIFSMIFQQMISMFFSNNFHIWCRTPTLAKCGGEAQHLEKLGIWSPLGLPNV